MCFYKKKNDPKPVYWLNCCPQNTTPYGNNSAGRTLVIWLVTINCISYRIRRVALHSHVMWSCRRSNRLDKKQMNWFYRHCNSLGFHSKYILLLLTLAMGLSCKYFGGGRMHFSFMHTTGIWNYNCWLTMHLFTKALINWYLLPAIS